MTQQKILLNFIDNIEKYIGKNCSENIASMKSIADYCSKSPISHSDSNAALSIISFTDKPDLIDSELLFRPEKIYFPDDSGPEKMRGNPAGHDERL